MMKKWFALAPVAAVVVACTDAPSPVETMSVATPRAAVQSSSGIAGSYVVTLRDRSADVDGIAVSLASVNGGRIQHVYHHSIRGFAIRNISEAAAARIAQDSRVASVEQDQMAYANTTQTPTPSWGLDRVDQVNLPLNSSYTYSQDGTGVHAY